MYSIAIYIYSQSTIYIQCDGWACVCAANREICGCVLDKASLMSSTFILFLSLVLICKKVEHTLSHKYVVAKGSNIRNASFDICGYDSETYHSKIVIVTFRGKHHVPLNHL